MDIGAANGAMTLIAASFGSDVYSYEPDPMMNRVLRRNVNLNEGIKSKITVSSSALGARDGEIDFAKGSDSKVLSDIIFAEIHKDSTAKIKVIALSGELNNVHQKDARLVIKMDIEGAEWGILSDKKTLQSLHSHSALLLLAVHPGFYRPHRKFFPGLTRISFEIWRARNYFEAKRFFSEINKYATVKRTNLNPINNSKNFAFMCLAGYHEYVINFGATKRA
jgi:FkbM family methyltransferase